VLIVEIQIGSFARSHIMPSSGAMPSKHNRGKHSPLRVKRRPAPDVRYGSKADIGARPIHVRFTPNSGHRNSVVERPLSAKSGHSALRQRLLFDHLVGTEQKLLGDCQPKCLGSRSIDGEIEFSRLLDRDIGRLCTA